MVDDELMQADTQKLGGHDTKTILPETQPVLFGVVALIFFFYFIFFFL